MTKEFFPGLIGTHRVTHDMSIPRRGSLVGPLQAGVERSALASMGIASLDLYIYIYIYV